MGFYITLFSALSFFARVFERDPHVMTWFVSLPLALVGVCMVLYGAGEWGRWGYLLVFLSIPVTLVCFAFAHELVFPHNEKTLVPVIFAGVVACVILAAVQGYYERRAKSRPEFHSQDDVSG